MRSETYNEGSETSAEFLHKLSAYEVCTAEYIHGKYKYEL